jgi:hypothetical protein
VKSTKRERLSAEKKQREETHNTSPSSRYASIKAIKQDEDDQFLVFKAVHFHNYFLLRSFFYTLKYLNSLRQEKLAGKRYFKQEEHFYLKELEKAKGLRVCKLYFFFWFQAIRKMRDERRKFEIVRRKHNV